MACLLIRNYRYGSSAILCAFDVLELNGQDLRDRPLEPDANAIFAQIICGRGDALTHGLISATHAACTVRCRTNRSRTRCWTCKSSCAAVLVATNFIVRTLHCFCDRLRIAEVVLLCLRVWGHVLAIDRQHVVSVGRIGEPWDHELEGHSPRLLAYGAENTVFWSRVVGRQLVLVSDHFIVFW